MNQKIGGPEHFQTGRAPDPKHFRTRASREGLRIEGIRPVYKHEFRMRTRCFVMTHQPCEKETQPA